MVYQDPKVFVQGKEIKHHELPSKEIVQDQFLFEMWLENEF